MVWWIPAAMTVAGSLMSMSAQGQAADAARQNANMARIAGRTEADLAELGSDLQTRYIESGTKLDAGLIEQGAALEAFYARREAERRRAAARIEANALNVQAGQVVAESQRDVLDVRRVTQLAESRALALAAASGGGATAPTVVKIISRIAGEGAYNAARALYAGEEKARQLKLQALIRDYEGEQAFEAGEDAALMSEYRGKAGSAARRFSGQAQAAMTRFGGMSQAQMARLKGEAGFNSGQAQARAYTTMQTATLFNTAGSLFSKYGGGGPSMTPTSNFTYSGYDYAGGPAYG